MVENTEGRKEADKEAGVIADEDEGDFEVIQPTDNWQTLKAGKLLLLCPSQKYSLVLDLVCVCVRPGSASRFPCEAESADRPEGGPIGRGAA